MLNLLSFILVVVGALNWGFTGLLHLNLVDFLFGTGVFAKLVYSLVAFGGLYLVFQVVSNKGQLNIYE